MKRFIICFILSLIGLSMLMQPAIASNDQDLDTVEIYNPFYHVFFDTTLDETTYVKGSYIETPYLITDSTDIGGKVKISSAGVDVKTAVAQAFKAEYNISSQLGAYVHGIKVEQTRTADIQPVTGCWFGGQFVLNAGTSAWDDINKPAYAVQGIIKGNQWDGTHDVNAARFELQSSGSVRDIVYILANTGTSVSSSMMYMPTHISLPYMINMNVQSNATVTGAIHILSGGGGSYNYGIDLSSATINTADLRFSNGALIYNKHLDSLIVTEANVKIIGNFTATTYLNLPKVDSAIYADSAGWAGLLDGYNEDYFLDTLNTTDDITEGAVNLYEDATNELDSIYYGWGTAYGTEGWKLVGDSILVDTTSAAGNGGGLTGHDSTHFIYSDTVDVGEFISWNGTKIFEVITDSHNVYIGDGAGTGAGDYNMFFGTGAGASNTTGDYNLGYGYHSMYYNTTGYRNMAIGYLAMEYAKTGRENIALGRQSGHNLGKAGSSYGIAIGAGALYVDSVGSYNIGIGYSAGYGITTGMRNVFLGANAGLHCGGAASDNVYIGCLAGDYCAGSYNIGIGYLAADRINAGGLYNIGIGYNALGALTTGDDNVGIGYYAGLDMTTGIQNVCIGRNAGANITDGNYNVCIGRQSGYSMTTGSQSVFIGYRAGVFETASNRFHLAVSISDTLIYGEFDNNYIFIKDSLYCPSIVVDNLYGPSPLNIGRPGDTVYISGVEIHTIIEKNKELEARVDELEKRIERLEKRYRIPKSLNRFQRFLLKF